MTTTRTTAHKMGRDITVGDVIDSGQDGILIAAFREYDSPLIPITGPGRIGYNASGVEIAVYDNHSMRVRTVQS